MEEKEKEEIIVPTNDYVFKRIFGRVGNEAITKELIEAIIDRKIEKIDLSKNPILEKDIRTDKIGILDIKATFEDGTICDIEIQCSPVKDIEKRILYYWAKLYTSGIQEGMHYKKLKNTICILINKTKIGKLKDIEKYHTKWRIKEEEKGQGNFMKCYNL